MTEKASLPEVIAIALEREQGTRHYGCDGKVVSFDETTKTVNVQPMIKRPLRDPDTDQPEYEALPIIPNVRVIYPRTTLFEVYFPLVAGDTVWLSFSDFATTEYRTTGQVSAPRDVTRNGLSYPVAFPGSSHDANASAATGNVIAIGAVSGDARIEISETLVKLAKTATDFVALASLVDARFNAVVTAFNAHVHTGVTTGPGSSGAPGTPLGAQATVAATIVKAK